MTDPRARYGEPDVTIAGLSIWALSWQFPESGDYWDGNWINILALAEAPGAHVSVQGPWLRNDEVVRLRDQLLTVNRDLKGEAELACMEPALSAKLTCKSLGRVEVVVEITPDHLSQAHRFVFELDQTYLGPIILACNRLLARFPLRGHIGASTETDP